MHFSVKSIAIKLSLCYCIARTWRMFMERRPFSSARRTPVTGTRQPAQNGTVDQLRKRLYDSLNERNCRERSHTDTERQNLTLSSATIDKLVANAKFTSYHAGQTVIQAGLDPQLWLYYFFEKTLRAPRAMRGGEEAGMLFAPHEFLGWSALPAVIAMRRGEEVTGCIRQATVQANFDCIIARWDTKNLEDHVRDELARIAEYWLHRMARDATPAAEEQTCEITVVAPAHLGSSSAK